MTIGDIIKVGNAIQKGEINEALKVLGRDNEGKNLEMLGIHHNPEPMRFGGYAQKWSKMVKISRGVR